MRKNSFKSPIPLKGALLGMSFHLCFSVLLAVGGTKTSLAKNQDLREEKILRTHCVIGGVNEELLRWSFSDLLHSNSKLRKIATRELDPKSGKPIRWEGVLLSSLIDQAIEQLPLEKKAQIDLVILKGETGKTVQIPRALISKYPLLLAYQWETKKSEGVPASSLMCVVPWTSKPKILAEELPLDHYFITQVSEIEFTSYRDRFASLFLKKRTDPSAMRGEKIVVQNCSGCHTVKSGWQLASFKGGHPPISGKVKAPMGLNEKNWKAIDRYLQIHRSENSISISEFGSSTGSCEARQPAAGCAMKTE